MTIRWGGQISLVGRISGSVLRLTALTVNLLVLSFPLTAIAIQSRQGDSGLLDKGQRIERMTKELGLNAEQKAKVESIFNEQKK